MLKRFSAFFLSFVILCNGLTYQVYANVCFSSDKVAFGLYQKDNCCKSNSASQSTNDSKALLLQGSCCDSNNFVVRLLSSKEREENSFGFLNQVKSFNYSSEITFTSCSNNKQSFDSYRDFKANSAYLTRYYRLNI